MLIMENESIDGWNPREKRREASMYVRVSIRDGRRSVIAGPPQGKVAFCTASQRPKAASPSFSLKL